MIEDFNNNNNNNNNLNYLNYYINTFQTAHLTSQIRLKQLAAEKCQNIMKDNLIDLFESIQDDGKFDKSDKELLELFRERFNHYFEISKKITNHLLDENKGGGIKNIGYPNQRNRTMQQLTMVKQWMESIDSSYQLFDQLKQGRYHYKLSNSTSDTLLPQLQSDNDRIYWGNENPSVSSLLLYGITKIMGFDFKDIENEQDKQFLLMGGGGFSRVPFLNPEYSLNITDEDCLIDDNDFNYPFANKKSMILFGSYQFGGQRRFGKQLIFGPEDCSSSVGKSVLLKDGVRHFNTEHMIKAFNDPSNQYGFKKVTHLKGTISSNQLESIEPGDIYLTVGHTALFTTKPNSFGKIGTIEFSRNLEIDTIKKVEGGGCLYHNLHEKTLSGREYYVLRPNQLDFKESQSLNNFIPIIDNNYLNYFNNYDINNWCEGDCKIFF